MFLSLLEAAVPAITRTQIDLLLDRLLEFGISAGKHILIAAIVYVIGRAIIGIINRVVARLLNRQHIDPSVQTFLRSMIKILLTILLIISVIGALGINTTSFAALLASAGVAVGMALSGNLQNFAGGLVILLFKPYRVGDWIEAQGVQGTVREIQIFHTVVLTVDGKQVYMPNGSLSTSVVVNFSKEEVRRVQWKVGVDYGEDVNRVREKLLVLFREDGRILQSPDDKQPFVAIDALAESSVDLVARVWVKSADYWPVYYDMQQRIYELFNREGINIPYPQRVVHLVKE